LQLTVETVAIALGLELNVCCSERILFLKLRR
jgi:hypothetical protein